LNLAGVLRCCALVVLLNWGAAKLAAQDALANNTVLIVRHAEKSGDKKDKGLTVMGEHRAEAYVRYFQPFHEDGLSLKISALYAGKDSNGSDRPRLTLEPLSKATGMTLDTSVGTNDPGALVAELRHRAHGRVPLICWRHGKIPALLTAFGASPEELLPGGKWPDATFDWVILLRFDAQGKLVEEKKIVESLKVQ
jgi:hypothetical protein